VKATESLLRNEPAGLLQDKSPHFHGRRLKFRYGPGRARRRALADGALSNGTGSISVDSVPTNTNGAPFGKTRCRSIVRKSRERRPGAFIFPGFGLEWALHLWRSRASVLRILGVVLSVQRTPSRLPAFPRYRPIGRWPSHSIVHIACNSGSRRRAH
jgi:hypothetical protein